MQKTQNTLPALVENYDGLRVFHGDAAAEEVVRFLAADAPLLAGSKYRLPEVISAAPFDFSTRVHPDVVYDTVERNFRIIGQFTAEQL